MIKHFSSKFQVCKNIKGKHKNLWGNLKCIKFRAVRMLKKKTFIINQKTNRLSSFGRVLNIKRIFKNFYLKKTKFLKLLLKRSNISKSKTITKLVSFLESQIDIILYRGYFVNSLYMSRQIINHGFIYINSKQICSKSIILSYGDIIELKTKNFITKKNLLVSLKQRRLKQNYIITTKNKKQLTKVIIRILNNKSRNITPIFKLLSKQQFIIDKFIKLAIIPKNLEINFIIFKIIFLWDPNLNNTYYPVNLKSSFNEILY
jgi:ribosomal protein S4